MHHQFTAPVGGRWTFSVISPDFDTALAVTRTCGDPRDQIACIEEGSKGAADTVNVVLDANETVYVVVDGFSSSSTVNQGAFTLTGSVSPVRQVGDTCDTQGLTDECAYGSVCDIITQACVATVCGNGVAQPEGGEECDDGANNGPNAACSTDCKLNGNTCAAPFDLRQKNTSQTPGGLFVAGSTDGFTNDHTPSCFSEMISTSNHRDVVYELKGNGVSDEHWEITLTGGTTSDLILDIGSACVARNARIFCSPDADSGAPKTASFVLGKDESVFIWVDSEVTTVQNYTLTGAVTPTFPVGSPCNPFNTVSECGKGLFCDGTGTCAASVCGDLIVSGEEECDEGVGGGNGCTADCYREGDTCNAPYDLNVVGNVGASGAWRHAGDITPMKADYIPYCEPAAGYNDVVYVFEAPYTGTYTFTETQSFDAVLYASSVCPDTSGSPDLACTPNEYIVVPMSAGETVFLFVERTGSTTQGVPTSNTNYVIEAVWAP
jgi:hypothetical protein